MQLNLSQQMRMSQQMRLAPRMIQSMEILQLPVMALEEKVEQELQENPLLERIEGDPDAPHSEEQREDVRSEANDQQIAEKELIVDGDSNNEADFERLLEMASEWPDDNYTSGSKPSANRISDDGDRQHDAISNVAQKSQSLNEYLVEQYGYFDIPREVREFGEFLIQSLDHHGRLPTGLS
ncbi:MAG: RNA polymerase sigma-54 factor, partial [Planctomycetaceae bacterium]|nr:RNA polymerase sigma-54 factor [Planctomycetaceae bacterium]